MNIPKEKLGVIGLSIKVNRKVKLRSEKSGKWTQTNFAKGICAQKTLINMERGIPGRFYDVYAESAKKLELELRYDPEVDKKINNLIPKLHKAIDFYELKKIEKYLNELIMLLKDYRNALWYCDLYFLLDRINEFYFSDAIFENDTIETISEMIGEFSKATNEILEFLIFNTTYNNQNKNYIKRFYKYLNFKDSNLICGRFCELIYYYISNRAVSFLSLSKTLTDHCANVKNYVRLLEVYSFTINFLSYYDPSEIPKYLTKANMLIESTDTPISKKAEFNYNIGVAYFECEDYKSALEAFEKCYEYDEKCKGCNKTLVKSFLFIAKCQRELQMSISIPFYSKKKLQDSGENVKKLYEYYLMEDEVPAFVRQRFLMDEVLPILEPEDEIIIILLKNELNRLISETNHYKDAVIYDIRTKELIK